MKKGKYLGLGIRTFRIEFIRFGKKRHGFFERLSVKAFVYRGTFGGALAVAQRFHEYGESVFIDPERDE
ncbi:MAG: hypothetical protein K6A31_10225 [Fibrobacter sp.]|nr:hypothetical protein [Fibrobacter sp.]